jgi:phosphopantetheine adenylyltransferase
MDCSPCSGSNKRPRVGYGYAEREHARLAKQVEKTLSGVQVTPKEKDELIFESFSDQHREKFLVDMAKAADDEHEARMMVYRKEGLNKAVELTAMQRLQRAKPEPEDETWFKKSYFEARLIEITQSTKKPEVIALTQTFEVDCRVLSGMAIITYNKDMDVHKIRAATRYTSDVMIFTLGREQVILGVNEQSTHVLKHGDMVLVRGLRATNDSVHFQYEKKKKMEVQVS